MNRFIVISPNTEKIEAAVREHFPDFNYEIAPGVWAVAAANKGPSEICETLGISGKESNNAGIAFTLDSYYGFYDPTLWEKFNLWEDQ